MNRAWMIRAGKNGKYFNKFISNGIVAIGWGTLGNIDTIIQKEEITKRYKILHPVETDAQVRNAVLQIYRFIHEISIDDTVITYDGGNRIYEIGIIRSDVIWNQNKIPELPRTRSVQWIKTIQRDMVSAKYKGSLEALLTLFEINTYIANDMLQHAQPTELAFGNNK
jgi:restriction system protein